MTLEEALGLLGRRTRLHNRKTGMSWEGEVVAVVDKPAVIVDLPGERRVVLAIDHVDEVRP